MSFYLRRFDFILLFVGVSFGIGCHRAEDKVGEATSVSIRIPSASEFSKLSSKVGSQSVSAQSAIDYNLLCFAVNVKGGSIASTPARTCEIERGLIVGSVPPGGELALDLPSGVATFEVYGFLRTSATQSCPAFLPSGWDWPLQKTYFLGQAASVTLTPPEAKVAVQITLPDSSANLLVQNGWGAACANLGSPIAKKNSGRILLGSKILVGSQFMAYSRLSNKTDLKVQSGTRFQVHNWKASLE